MPSTAVNINCKYEILFVRKPKKRNQNRFSGKTIEVELDLKNMQI